MNETYYLFSNGDLKRKDNVIRLTTPDKNFKDIKIETTKDIYLFGEISLNTKCLNYLGQLGISLHIFNYYGFYTGSFYPKESNISGRLLVNQVKFYEDLDERVHLAKKFIEGASHNIKRNLAYYKRRGKEVGEQLEEIRYLDTLLDSCMRVEEVMGIEGNIRKQYYKAWNIIVDQKIDFVKRVKRPPDNMINTLISFINTLIYTTCLGEIYKTQLNPTISYLHVPGTRRFSLCLDLAEIFKPLIADRMIFSLLNKNIITEKDFSQGSNFYYLGDKGKKKILMEFDQRMNKTIKHKVLGRDVSYRHLIKLECYKLIKHLMNDKKYEPFKIWW